MKIIRSANPRQEASDALAKIFSRYRDIPVLFLTSGGSALSLLEPEILAEHPQMTVSVLDEHYVADPNERNYEKLKKTKFFKRFLEKTPHPTSLFRQRTDPPQVEKRGGGITFDPYDGDVEEAGRRFDAFLKNWRVKYPNGKIVVTAGMGTDGHTAGIVPFSDAVLFGKLFNDPETLVVGYKTDYGPFHERVTATFSLLKNASNVILYAVGNEKVEAMHTFLSEQKPVHEFPTLFLKTLPPVTFFTGSSLISK